MSFLREFFAVNRSLVLFVYGQTFFTMGLAIFLQSRRHSHLRLARDLRWLAAFGILHGLHEWGEVFIPIQATYVPEPYIELLLTLRIVLLGVSLGCLLVFGALTVADRWPWSRRLVIILVALWAVVFWLELYATPTMADWYRLSSIWARYLLGLPGGLLAAYGLRFQAETNVAPLRLPNIYRTLQVVGLALGAYAFLGGMIVSPGTFFPANVLNSATTERLLGIPIEVFRSTTGLILAVSIIRFLEIFDIEVDRLIEGIEVERVQAAERDRIGQEIHDGAIQAIYSASLILESMGQHIKDSPEAAIRLDRTKRVMDSAITDLRRYMVSLRSDEPTEPLSVALQHLASDPRFGSLARVQLKVEAEPDLKQIQVGYALAIVQESLSNAVRHAAAHNVIITVCQEDTNWTVRIEDDGHGFNEQEVTLGFGLRAMRDRARLLGGKLKIESRSGHGTSVVISIPSTPEEDGA